MKKILNSYPLVLFGETIGAKETLRKENRYKLLARSLKVLSTEKTDEEIWEFYQWRKNGYRHIRLFTSFILIFFFIMAYILSGSWLVATSAGLAFIVVYGAIAVTVKAERNYAHLWDDKAIFMEFLKLNKSELFNPEKFDQLLQRDKVEPKPNELTFQEELSILKKETNAFNSIRMEAVIQFFDIIRESADYPDGLKCVQISDKDFVRFIKARFVEDSKERLNIKLIEGDKSTIKALFFNFYHYSTIFSGESKKGKREKYIELYLSSFETFDKIDLSNFTNYNALEYSTEIKHHSKME